MPLIPVSSHKKTGLETLWEHILTAVAPETEEDGMVETADRKTPAAGPDTGTTPEGA